jgi:uncharacterized protein YkwD
MMGSKTFLAAGAVQLMLLALPLSASAQDVTAAPSAVTASADGCAGATAIPTAANMAQSSAAVLCLVNFQRISHGLKAVRNSSLLARTATSASGDMVRLKYFAHVSPAGMSLKKRAAKVGYRGIGCPPTLGEVLAFGSGTDATAAALVQMLMDDPAHRTVMLDRRFRDVGVGLAIGAPLDGMGDGSTLAINFGKR